MISCCIVKTAKKTERQMQHQAVNDIEKKGQYQAKKRIRRVTMMR